MRRSKNGVAAVGVSLLCLARVSAVHAGDGQPGSADGVHITPSAHSVRVEINGQLFTEYHFQDAAKPYCYPIIGPGGWGITRDWPMKDTPGEEHDHPHHRGCWFGHGAVNGNDLWTERENTGRILHVGFTELGSGKDTGIIKSRNQWVAPNGKTLCTDDRTLRFYNTGDAPERRFDFEITIRASHGDVLLGDTKEAMLGFRVAESMRLSRPARAGGQPRPGDGHIVNSAGVRDAAAWGKRADWVDYYGPVNGKIVGVAMFDHPSNLRHPTGWHARDYGLLAANPFAAHDFEKRPEGTGNYTIRAGQSLTFRYRIYLHEGDEKQGQVAERYREYAQSK